MISFNPPETFKREELLSRILRPGLCDSKAYTLALIQICICSGNDWWPVPQQTMPRPGPCSAYHSSLALAPQSKSEVLGLDCGVDKAFLGVSESYLPETPRLEEDGRDILNPIQSKREKVRSRLNVHIQGTSWNLILFESKWEINSCWVPFFSHE